MPDILAAAPAAAPAAPLLDAARFYGMARGSATERAAIVDLLLARGLAPASSCRHARSLLVRVVHSGPVLLWPRATFTPAAWAAAGEVNRYVFYHDLAGRKLLLGRSREEVLRMLGPSNTAPAGADYLTYIIKQRGSGEYTFDAITLLHAQLGPRGKVERVFLRGD